MQSSDEMLNPEVLSTNMMTPANVGKSTPLDEAAMMRMFQQWSMNNKGKHKTARAERAKARIKKRKSKR